MQENEYGVIVIGGGHAGIEASLAAARLGVPTLLLTLNMDAIGLMPCNPAIGGPAKGLVVREIDALGGQMALAADATQIQIRMLNVGKGPAVQALRAQIDKRHYQRTMMSVVQNEPYLDVKQGEACSLLIENGQIKGVYNQIDTLYRAQAVVITTGTYLNGRIIIGDHIFSSGPSGLPNSVPLGHYLREIGLPMARFKTGTPARVDKRSLDFSKMQEQPGDIGELAFSFLTTEYKRPKISCYLTYTNEKTHQLIRDNIHLAPMYSGIIEGVGARYCPSIEDKVMRFRDRDKHQIFIEPEGLGTTEYYVQGLSTGFPEELQMQILKTVPGLEQVKMMRPAYAIEYDCLDPTQLQLSLQHKEIKGLFAAGQINGTSGYEEAAGQGLLAGINAALLVLNKEPFTMTRSESYIGVMIDDLVTKGVSEPYRLFTSLSEYRLLLRQDNADLRLTEKGYALGLVKEDRYAAYLAKKEAIEKELARLKEYRVSPHMEKVSSLLQERGSNPLQKGINAQELLLRPQISYADIKTLFGDQHLPLSVEQQVEIQIKYAGYIKKQLAEIERFDKKEKKKLPADLDYLAIKGLSVEARQKLQKQKPANIGQASRITGVSPADISVLLIYLEQKRRIGLEEEKKSE